MEEDSNCGFKRAGATESPLSDSEGGGAWHPRNFLKEIFSLNVFNRKEDINESQFYVKSFLKKYFYLSFLERCKILPLPLILNS